MEQDIKRLKEKINNIKKYDTYRYDWTETDVQTVEHLIKAYKELEEENTELKECLEVTSKALDNVAYDQIPIAIADLMIPKVLVEEKIEEYENNMKLYENETHNIFNENNIRQEVITVLQELLEKRK